MTVPPPVESPQGLTAFVPEAAPAGVASAVATERVGTSLTACAEACEDEDRRAESPWKAAPISLELNPCFQQFVDCAMSVIATGKIAGYRAADCRIRGIARDAIPTAV